MVGKPMPEIRREKLPERLLLHLVTRVRERSISSEQLILLARWPDKEPEVPSGKWFKRFLGFTVCGEGEFIKTLLLSGQAPMGHEID
jgi:ribosomal protein S18 acetylase RimI-like enzyme